MLGEKASMKRDRKIRIKAIPPSDHLDAQSLDHEGHDEHP
jgi:hypothetical protein